jgi:hypothetical protein
MAARVGRPERTETSTRARPDLMDGANETRTRALSGPVSKSPTSTETRTGRTSGARLLLTRTFM